MLHLFNYKKAYGGPPVLQIEDLRLKAGIYWLKGENGAGKTTLLKSIAGLIPLEGDVEVDGINLRKQRQAYTTAVSFAEAEPVYPAFLTGEGLLQFYLQTKGGEESRSLAVAEALGIAPFLKQKVATYSSGMMKKLSLVLCFTGKPTLLLLDEPFITLDVAAVDTLRQLITAASASFIISSHQELALAKPFTTLRILHQTLQPEGNESGAF